MKFQEHTHGMTAFDSNRLNAVARPIGGHGMKHWCLRSTGFCWIDCKPAKRRIGTVQPHLKTVKTKAEARKILQEISNGQA